MRNSLAGLSGRAVAAAAARPSLSRTFVSTASCCSSSSSNNNNNNKPAPPKKLLESSAVANPRWLSDLRARMKNCLSPELDGAKATQLKANMAFLDENWLELSAGRERFVTDEAKRGLNKLPVAWGDMDSMVRHINNIIYNQYAESGRVQWALNFANTTNDPKRKQEWIELVTPRNIGLILASIKTDYKLPILFPDEVTVLHRLMEKPEYTSDRLFLEVVIYSHKHKRPAARCFEENAVYDYRANKKAPLRPWMVDEFQAVYEQQEQQKQDAEREVARLEELVEDIERTGKTSA